MKNNNIILITIAIVTLLTFIIGATYAYFATGNLNITNVVNANTITEQNNMVFDTLGGAMLLNVTASNMVEAKQGNIAAENNTTLTVNFTSNTDYSMVCTYDIIYEWTSSDKYMTHTTGVTDNEFVIQGTLASNAHVSEGTNNIKNETDLSTLTYTNYAATVVSGAQIDGTGSTTSTAVWTLSSKFYNVTADQSALSGKTYAGKFKVANVSCQAGSASNSNLIGYWYDESSLYQFPNYDGVLQPTGLETGKYTYVKQDTSKYYVCLNDGNGHEVCLSQPYTQYGLEGHTAGNSFTSEQEESVMQALYQAFIDAGIDIYYDDDCMCTSDGCQCSFLSKATCFVYEDGNVMCANNDIDSSCCVAYSYGVGCGC